MVRVVIDHNLIGVPEPVGDIVIIERRHGKIETAEPEALAIAALQMEDMTGTESACKAAMFEWMI